MMGPLTSLTFLSLSLALALLHTHTLHAKSLSAARGGGRGQDGTANVRRLRRDLRDALPYEAQMMSYPAAGAAEARGRGGGELYYRPGLGQALQRLAESDQRRDQEAAYLAGLLRLLSEAEGREEEEDEGPVEDQGPDDGPGGDFRGPYPPDYDDTDRGVSHALLQRYRQERMLQAGLQAGLQQELQIPDSSALSRGVESHNREQEALRYLVAKILSSIGPGNPQGPPGRRARRDLVAVGGGARSPAGPAHHGRSRRSLDDAAPPPPAPQGRDAPLLRVKRLGDEEEEEEEEERGVAYGPPARQGLQRTKRVDGEPRPGRERRRRSAATPFDTDALVRQILQYLPE